MSLIHDNRVFTKKWILDKKKAHNFANPVAVEKFLWAIEISAQLQQADNGLILKGGTAAQLYLPVQKQRGSVDIDMKYVPSITESAMSSIVDRVEKTLPSIHFTKYTPNSPYPSLPLVTYSIEMPSSLEGQGKYLEIKADILLEDPKLPTTLVKDKQTFALKVNQMRIPTLGTCIGDKLLTLARGSVGMTKEEDYPKQMYDIDLLSEASSPGTFADIIDAVRKLAPIEASYRGLKTNAGEAIRDICKLATSYAKVDTTDANSDHKKHTQAFQQFYVNRDQELPLYEWASRALRIRFLATLVGIVLEDELHSSEAANTLKMVQSLANSLERIPGSKVKAIRLELLKLFTDKPAYVKELKGKPLTRVFWEVVTASNLDQIKKLAP